MRCDELIVDLEGIADGSIELSAEGLAHLASCPSCAARLEAARAIERLLVTRDLASPSSSFTATVMARVVQEQWNTERVVDLGFNLLMIAGALVIVAGGAGLAWSLGFLSISIDLRAVWNAIDGELTGRMVSQVQTTVMAAALLTTALVLWWWAETAAD